MAHDAPDPAVVAPKNAPNPSRTLRDRIPAMVDTRRSYTTPSVVYWMLAFVSIAFGVVAIFSIGLPFVVLGLLLVILGPFRTKRLVFWPALAGAILAIVGWMGTTPLSCKTSVGIQLLLERGRDVAEGSTEGRTTCDRLLLPDAVGADEPSAWPSIATGLALGLVGATVTRTVLRRRTG